MASSSSRGDRVIHQDYIARIRYSNALPPPPNPPKLLNIPNTGLASGQYTTPGFASRLARDQPLNIEADAELGMPLDLVGMPGIFDGDESSIQAPLNPPPVHPHDRALLRPLSSLGKPKFAESGVSFLRRTEYISSYTFKMRSDSANARSLIRDPANLKKRTNRHVDKESPEYIQEQVEKSFDIAALALKDKTRVRHPSKRNVRLVESMPLLPDLDAFPDIGGYVTVKFLTNPVAQVSGYDKRLECGILRPLQLTEEEERLKQEQQEAHERDPERNPAPDDKLNYEFFLADTAETAANFKRKFNVYDPERDDDSLYTSTNSEGARAFRFKRVRAYETSTLQGSADTKYSEEVAVVFNDGQNGHHQKAAYYYPIIQRASIRPQRNKNIQRTKLYRSAQEQAEQEDIVDFIDATVRDPDETEEATRQAFKEDPYGQPAEEAAEETEGYAREEDADAEGDFDANGDLSD